MHNACYYVKVAVRKLLLRVKNFFKKSVEKDFFLVIMIFVIKRQQCQLSIIPQ